MLTLPRHVRVFATTEPFDMRGSFAAMAGRVRRLGLEPVDGNLYVFFSRRKALAGVLYFDGTGWCLFRKDGSERQFQAVAKLRLNSLFAGGTEGAHRAAVLLGIVATCKRVGVDVQAYLSWVFVRAGTHRAKYNLRAADLLPAAYKRSLAPTA